MVKSVKQRIISYEEFIYMPNIIFKSLGYDILETPRPFWQKILMRVYLAICFCSHLYIVFYLFLRIIQWDTIRGNPSNFIRYAELFFLVLNSEIKIISFVYYRHRLQQLIFKLRDIYPVESCCKKYRVGDFYWSRTAIYGFRYFFFSVLTVLFSPLLQSVLVYFYQYFKIRNEAQFPYLRAYAMQLSFETKSPLNYALAQLLEFTCTHFIMNFNMGTDVWMMSLSALICMHFAYLGQQLEQYKPSRYQEREDCAYLSNIVRKHRHLLGMHKELNNIFGMLVAYNLFTTASILCCVAYYTMVQGFNLGGVSYLMYFVSCSAQFYAVCHFSQLLIDLSENLAKSAYSQTWYDGSIAYRKQLLFFILKTQKPVYLTAHGVIIISRDTFKILMKITYNAFALMSRVIEND
ncbi:odorant receptor 49a [Drosophila busckii]|uniref:odorant receptor 49a n=1 Tax=Drosophila busckii TaxID=30019 RepID=UPI00083F213E|nr:odorant receptor 49a [Drosophila busckii]